MLSLCSAQCKAMNLLADKTSVLYAEEREEKEEHSILPKANVTRICTLAHQNAVDEVIAARDR